MAVHEKANAYSAQHVLTRQLGRRISTLSEHVAINCQGRMAFLFKRTDYTETKQKRLPGL